METTTLPKGRFSWEGQTVVYTVKAKGANEIVAPADAAKGLDVRVLDTHKVADGVEARVAVAVGSGVFF